MDVHIEISAGNPEFLLSDKPHSVLQLVFPSAQTHYFTTLEDDENIVQLP